jgi:formamidopyrimidine-DNA glycosylase
MADNNKNDKGKDYIINLRVSRETYEKIRQKAKENQESVSNLIRKAIDDSAEIFSDLTDELFGRSKSGKFENVTSYHKSKAAKELKCDNCGAVIAAGAPVTVGETTGAKKYFFCENCK